VNRPRFLTVVQTALPCSLPTIRITGRGTGGKVEASGKRPPGPKTPARQPLSPPQSVSFRLRAGVLSRGFGLVLRGEENRIARLMGAVARRPGERRRQSENEDILMTKTNQSIGAVLLSRTGAPAVLTAVLGMLLSVALFLLAYYAEWSSIRSDFDSLADHRFNSATNMFRESTRLIDFMDDVFMVGPPVSAPEFTGYLRSLKNFLDSDVSKNLELHGLTWAPRVPYGQREDYQRAARAVIDPAYHILQADKATEKVPPNQRADSYPCYLSLGNTVLTGQLGRDLSLDPADWKVMQQACDSGEAVATAPIKMLNGGRLGYRVFRPLFVVGNQKTVAERRKACTGFLCLDLDVGVVIDNALKSIQPVGVDILVYDDVGGSRTEVSRHVSRMQPSAGDKHLSDAHQLETTSPAEFFGRKLLLCCRSTEAFWAGRTIWQPWVLLIAGLTLTLAVTNHQFERAVRTSTIEQVVSTRLSAIQAEKAMLQYAQSDDLSKAARS
jgi:CHASE1-domain containing sensor protein